VVTDKLGIIVCFTITSSRKTELMLAMKFNPGFLSW